MRTPSRDFLGWLRGIAAPVGEILGSTGQAR
jgi:hypothetical protein